MNNKWYKTVLILFALVFISNCGSVPTTYYYRVNMNPAETERHDSPIPITLGIDQFEAEVVYEGDRIVYRDSPYEVQYYHYRRWVAPPKKIVKDAVVEQFQAAETFQRVVSIPTMEKLDFVLKGKIKAFEEWDENESWYGSVHIAFELYKTASNDIVWQDEFSKKTPVAQKEPVEVVKAISESLQKVIEQARMEIEKSLRN